LRDDIARHLHGDPIHARPDAWGYRAGKFLRRHSFALASVVLVLAVLIGAAVFSLQQARVARDALLRADQHAKDAAAENEFLISTFEGANPFNMKGAPLSAHELLQNTASNIDEEFGDNPRIRAKLHEAIGELFFSFKQISQAQREYEAALAADAAFLPASSPELMEAQITVQIQRLFQGQVDAAVPELQRIERESQLGGDAFLHVHYRARENLASAMTIRGEYAQATQLSESLLEESDQLAAKGMRTYAKYNLSNDYLQQENLTLAMRSIDDLSKNDVASGRLSPGALFHVREIAELLLELGRFNEAREIFARLQPQARKEPDLQSWFFADDLVHEGAALQGLGDETRAHATFAQAFQTFAKAREAFPQVLVDGEYGEALGWIAGGDYAQAGAHLNAILAMYAQMGLPDHPMALAAREALAEIELAHGSRTVRQQLEDVAAHQRPGLDRDLPRTLLTLARIAQSEQDTARTQMLLDETLDVLTRQGRPWHSFAYRAYLQRAALAEQRGEIAAAHAARMHALAAALIDFGEDHARSRAVLAALGAKDAAAGQALLHEARALVSMPPAEALYQRALGTLALVERSPAGSM
jgi:TolA-binding protein